MGLTLSASLTKSFRNLSKQIVDTNENTVKEVIANVHNQILVNSPIAKGIYISNNYVAENREDARTTDKNHSDNERKQEMRDLKVEVKTGKKYVLFNNLPYATAIEGGHSKGKAPDGVYLPAADQVSKFISKNKKDYKNIKWKSIK